MAFVNLPPNLQDMFYAISDRVAKLETGPNQPGYDADAAQATAVSAQALALSSQSTATTAQTQAINAGIQANIAQSQATIAQSQATIASSQAVAAQTSANGKNKILYGTSATPPAGTYIAGDIYYQYDGSNHIKGNQQYNGSSWQNTPFTQGTFTSLDAGAITTGTLSAIEINAGTGGTAFHVSPSGYLSAQGVYIKGNITADSGTFNGTIVALTGYFGGYGTTGNYWSIGSNGITGVGSATITAGQINGSSIYIGSTGQFQVDASGNLNASSATVTGTITTSNLTATGGTVGGFTLSSTNIYTANLNIASSGTISGGNSQTIYYGYGNFGGGSNTGGYRLYVTGTSGLIGDTTVTGYIYNSGYATTVSAANAYINSSTGLLARSSSSLRYKVDAQPQTIPVQSILQLAPKSFFDKAQADEKGTTDGLSRILGLIAEEVAQIPVIADFLMNKNDQGEPDSVNYDRIAVALLPLLQDHEARLNKLEGK